MKGKYTAKAALHHEVVSRESELVALRPKVERLERELAEAKARIAEYQTKLGAWSAEREEQIEERVATVVREAGYAAGLRQSAPAGYTAGAQDGLRSVAYRNHLIEEHGLDISDAREQVEAEATALDSRSIRRMVKKRAQPRGRQIQQRINVAKLSGDL